ncbi:serum paraoxonase/arylesterase family protein [Xylariales sp. PMI_506]|nr:serum paraoxonase/arylesterase family protein [Xylariales sp. PMI_506]
MTNFISTPTFTVALLSAILGYIYYAFVPEIQRAATVMGISRSPVMFQAASPDELVLIEGTTHCEDIHYFEPSQELYTACEDSDLTRFSWFPPLTSLNASVLTQARGGLFVIDPQLWILKTKKATQLKLENFSGLLVTHGIDVIQDPSAQPGEAVYIFAINHLPNPDFFDYSKDFAERPQKPTDNVPRARSQVEIFHHRVGSSTAQHLRSVWHPLIVTPNDVLALSPTRFLVTNDHFYQEGRMRELEGIFPGAKWTNTIYVELSGAMTGILPAQGVQASIALDGIFSSNGLGRTTVTNEILVASAMGGSLFIGDLTNPKIDRAKILIRDTIYLDSAIDNPSYFEDPYASSSFNASGFVLAGLGRAIDLGKTRQDPQGKDAVVAWHVTRGQDGWEKRVIFEDDGTTVRSASAGVLVPIDPAKEAGKRRAWLFITGFVSASIAAIKIDL